MSVPNWMFSRLECDAGLEVLRAEQIEEEVEEETERAVEADVDGGVGRLHVDLAVAAAELEVEGDVHGGEGDQRDGVLALEVEVHRDRGVGLLALP